MYFYDGYGTFVFTRPFTGENVQVWLDKSVVLEYKSGKMWKGDIYFSLDGFKDQDKFVEYLTEYEKKRVKDLKEKYAGYALQGILSNPELVKQIDGNAYRKVAVWSKRFAEETTR